jgi:hypothetical protein
MTLFEVLSKFLSPTNKRVPNIMVQVNSGEFSLEFLTVDFQENEIKFRRRSHWETGPSTRTYYWDRKKYTSDFIKRCVVTNVECKNRLVKETLSISVTDY